MPISLFERPVWADAASVILFAGVLAHQFVAAAASWALDFFGQGHWEGGQSFMLYLSMLLYLPALARQRANSLPLFLSIGLVFAGYDVAQYGVWAVGMPALLLALWLHRRSALALAKWQQQQLASRAELAAQQPVRDHRNSLSAVEMSSVPAIPSSAAAAPPARDALARSNTSAAAMALANPAAPNAFRFLLERSPYMLRLTQAAMMLGWWLLSTFTVALADDNELALCIVMLVAIIVVSLYIDFIRDDIAVAFASIAPSSRSVLILAISS